MRLLGLFFLRQAPLVPAAEFHAGEWQVIPMISLHRPKTTAAEMLISWIA